MDAGNLFSDKQVSAVYYKLFYICLQVNLPVNKDLLEQLDNKRGTHRSVLYLALWKRMQDLFWIPVQIPAAYVSLVLGLPENPKKKKICRGTLTYKFRKLCFLQ